MAGRGWEDWFEREEFIGQISDMRVQNLQVEREVVQKRTFTRWINLHLEKCAPPIEVEDLFQDIQDGYILMALLEELSGSKLLHGFKKSSHRIFRLNNIAKVLSFLEERNVKLVSIDAANVADGNASIILGLIWNIILFFQIKELTGNIRSQFPSSCSLSSIPTSAESETSCCSTASDERRAASAAMREHNKAIKKLLQWVQKQTRRFGVAVQDFGKSWMSGLAFLAVIKSIDPSLVDMRKALLRSPRENLEEAFRTAHYSLGIPRLLEPEDVMIDAPDEQSIITYVSQFLEHFPGLEEVGGSQPEEPNQIMERSTSLCRLNLRDSDTDHRRNGAHGSRVKERSSRFQRDCGQAPPKIFISSAPQGGAHRPRPLRPTTSRSWSTEDFSTESCPEGGGSRSVLSDSMKVSTEVTQISDSSQMTSAHSPPNPSAPGSLNTDSMNVDSAISSPDSWVDSDFGATPEKLYESASNGSLCDSGTAWEVHRAIPVEITTLDEGLFPSTEGGLVEEHSIESCVDEGVYSLSSLESSQEQARSLNNYPEAVVQSKFQNLPTDSAWGQKEGDGQWVGTSLINKDDMSEREKCGRSSQGDNVLPAERTDQPIMTLVSTGLATPYHSAEERPCGGSNKAVDQNGDLQDQDQESKLPAENPTKRKDVDCGEEGAKGKQGDVQLEETAEKLQDEAHLKTDEGVLREHPDPQYLADQGPALQETVATSASAAVPLITISTEPEMPEHQEALDKQNPAGDSEDPGPGEMPSCQASENVQHSPTLADPERECWDGSEGNDLGTLSVAEPPFPTSQNGVTQGRESPRHRRPDSPGQPFALATDSDPLAAHRDRQGDLVPDDSSSVRTPGPAAGRGFPQMKFFRPDLDENSPTDDLAGDPLEPMDLFYPDKDESIYTEPPEGETQAWPSVLSVSPLQPAPASQHFDDGSSEVPSRACSERNDVSHENSKEADEAPGSEEQLRLSAGRTGGLSEGARFAEGEAEQQLWCCTSENWEPASCSGSGEDILIPPILRHRKAPPFVQALESAEAAPQQAEREDVTDGSTPELYLLLLLWLLLYCFWLLPQMDVKMLPRLLLNL
eukprot:XP_011616903.1 PREDICTED: calmin isoform X1 [Takifugu rubripes]